MHTDTYYEILKVRGDATDEEVFLNFLRLEYECRQRQDEASFLKLCEAFYVLRDPILRQGYDRWLDKTFIQPKLRARSALFIFWTTFFSIEVLVLCLSLRATARFWSGLVLFLASLFAVQWVVRDPSFHVKIQNMDFSADGPLQYRGDNNAILVNFKRFWWRKILR